MNEREGSLSRRVLLWTALLGVFVLCDLALFGWLIFRSLSQREINRVILEARSEAEELARQIAGGVEERGLDLYTAIATESETQTYIDSVLAQRRIVLKVEILDREGRVVFRSERTETRGEPGDLDPEIPLQIREFERETPFEQVEVPVGNVGTFVIGISRRELEERLRVLRSELLRQASLIGGLTIALFLGAYLIIWRVFARARRLEQQAVEAERMAYVGTLAAGLAHEIRSPLNSLHLNMQMLEEEADHQADTSSRRRLIAITRSEIGRLEQLVTDFLSYARPRPLELETIEAAELLRHVVEVLGAQIHSRGAVVEIVDESDGAAVKVDRSRLGQLLLNLMSNALEATRGKEQARIKLRVGREGDQVVLSVEDNGVGIAPEDRERIFDVFFSKRKGGSGLGLAIVERIARAHGGRLQVESDPGAGTRVDLLLPAADPARAAAPVSDEHRPALRTRPVRS